MCVAFGDKKIRASNGDKKMCVILGDQKMCVVFDDKNADQISNGCGVNKSGVRIWPRHYAITHKEIPGLVCHRVRYASIL